MVQSVPTGAAGPSADAGWSVAGLVTAGAADPSVEAAVLHNFFWHVHWTWLDRKAGGRKAVLARLLQFNMTTGVVSILGNLGLMTLFVGWTGMPPVLGNLVTIATCHVFNFTISERVVFRPRRAALAAHAQTPRTRR